MNSDLQDLPSSPSQAGNFIISYEFHDHQYLTKQDTDKLLDFIDADKEVNVIFNNSDQSFFPRAFTDKDLNDFNDFDGVGLGGVQFQLEIIKPKVIKASNKIIPGTEKGFSKMNPAYNTSFGNASYQPDLVMISSNQRPGPDGSPALVPSGSQGFLPSGNMSETSELFAPVRQLTFSDIDQNSHIEDSYAQRSVSTPTRHGGVNTGEHNVNMNGIDGRDSDSGQEDSSDEREMSPEFRHLDGEADSQAEMTGTGAFDPTAMGINKEFLDNFTGRTSMGRMHMPSSVFSPLGSLGSRDMGLGFRHENGEGQANRTITPPLHSPRLDSPHHQSRSPYNSPRPPGPYGARSTTHQHVSDHQELQFSMSPTRNPSNFIPVQQNQYNIDILSSHNQGDLYNQYDFHRQSASPRNIAVPLQIRQSVSVGEERRTDTQVVTSTEGLSRSISKNSSQDNNEVNEILESDNNHDTHAVGEGNEIADGNNTCNANDENNGTEGEESRQYYSNVPAAEFEQRYLQRTHVSVKVPQATYDSMAGDYGTHASGSYDDVEQHFDEYGNENWEDENNAEGLSSETVQKSGMTAGSSNSETNEQRDLNEKSKGVVGQSDLGQKKSKKQAEKFHVEMRKVADNQNVNAHSEKGKYLSKNSERTNVKQVNNAVHGSSGSLTSGVNNKSQNTQSKVNGQPQSMPSQQPVAGLQPSSRLLQETVSQKNKTCQKFVSSAPAPQRNVSEQNGGAKEFKKPYDVNNKSTTCAGARKTLLHNSIDSSTDKGAKLKIRSTMGNIPQKQKQSNPNLPTAGRSSVPSSEAQKVNLGNQSRGLVPGQGPASRGSSLNNSGESIEGEGHQGRGKPVITQVEKTSPVVDKTRSAQGAQPLHFGNASVDVSGMEDIRHQLQGMLRLSHENLSGVDRSQYEHSDIIAGYAGDFAPQEFQRPADMSWHMLRKPQEEDLVENFPGFSSQFLVDSGNVSRSDVSLQSENQRLRDLLEKERYRRKHCENYIQQLNVKLLETQQQVAVAVSTDKRKDIMIEQLDKQLARVVEGWKKRDTEKDEELEHARQEKEEIENKLKKQEQMIGRFEHDMSEAVDALRQEKDRSAQAVEQLNDKITETEKAKTHAEEMLSAEQEKTSLVQQECDSLREARENLDKKLDQMQRRLHRVCDSLKEARKNLNKKLDQMQRPLHMEQDEWFQREQELLQRIEEVNEKNTKILQIERTKNEEQGKLAEEIMEQYQAATTKMKKLELDLDAALREKESMKVEIGIMEAKFENAQRVLEADLQSAMEKQIADQICDVQKRMEKSENTLREKHREQVVELNQRHKNELENVQSQVREGLLKKEEEFRKQMQELESRLQEYREENANLKLSKQKLESQRLEILTKLQYMMQSQWNEALTLLSTTPQRRRNPMREAESNQTSSTAINDSIQTVQSQSIPTVNFNLHSPCGPPPQDKAAMYSPGQDNVISHSTVKDELIPHGGVDDTRGVVEVRDEARDIESTAAAHLKEFQDYINSITQTPYWISSLEAHDQAPPPRVQTPNLPTPPELAALLQSHLQNIQQQQLLPSIIDRPHPDQSLSNQNLSSNRPLPHFANVNAIGQPLARGRSSSPPIDRSTNQSLPQLSHDHKTTPPRPKPGKSFPTGISQSEISVGVNDKKALQGFSPIYGELGRGAAAGWEGLRAVPIRPPQHGENDTVRSSQSQGYFQGGQSFSPPTKQSNPTVAQCHDNSIESIHSQDDQCVKLTDDYSHLSERVEQHESHQNELQHYIQMLLNKSPHDVDHDEFAFSHDNTQELDLNDTAQAAQLQKELDRIQELRRKQEASQKGRQDSVQLKPEKEEAASLQGGAEGHSKILNQEQMADIAKLLNQVKGQGQHHAEVTNSNPQIAELIEVLRHMQGPGAQAAGGDHKKGPKPSPRPGQQHPRGDKHKGLSAEVKRNVQFQPAKGLDVSRQSESSVKSGKSGQTKKIERKVAGNSVNKGDKEKGGNKPTAWK